jgi:hypothetical protein
MPLNQKGNLSMAQRWSLTLQEPGGGLADLDVGGAEAGHLGYRRRAVACRCSDPPRIDNLRFVVGRGIIRDGFAATISIDRQIPPGQSGRMDRRWSRNLQHPMFWR